MNKILFILLILFLIVFPKIGETRKKQLRVLVLDTGLDIEDIRFKSKLCPEIGKDFTGTELKDVNGHGTSIVGLIKENAKNSNYCLIIVKYFTNGSTNNSSALTNAYNYIQEIKPDIVNFSGGGSRFLEIESLTIQNLFNTKFFVAAGNDNNNIDFIPYFPASLNFNNVYPIGALNKKNKANFSNFGSRVTWEQGVNILSTVPYNIDESGYMFMSGSSMSTAISTGKYLYEHR